MAVVKSNGYGHGLVRIAKCFIQSGVEMLGVGSLNEAIQLREKRVKGDLIVLTPSPENCCREIVEYNVKPTICSVQMAKLLSSHAMRRRQIINIHIKVDTGMGRFGLAFDGAEDSIIAIYKMPGLRIEGIFSHLIEASDASMTDHQVLMFGNLIHRLRALGVTPKFRHIAASTAILKWRNTYLDMVRPGLLLYGLYPLSVKRHEYMETRPTMSLKSRILFIRRFSKGVSVGYGGHYRTKRKSTIAILPIGFVDGYNRTLGNGTYALLNDTRVSIVPGICMNQTMVDVTDVPNAEVGGVVTLFGKDNREQITVNELIDGHELIPNEIVCGISERIPRIYK